MRRTARAVKARKLWTVSFQVAALALLHGCATADAASRRSMLDDIARIEETRRDAPREVALGAELDREALVRAVLARNPDVEAALAGWRAALERQPQADALPDPMLEYAFAPASIGAQGMDFGQVASVRQDFPFPGTLSARSSMAIAEAAAARDDYETVRRELASSASRLFDELYTIERALEINAQHRELLTDLREIALAQLGAGRTPQDAPLQAELELRRVELDRLRLVAQHASAAARINGLLHRAPSTPLPRTPARIALADAELPPVRELHARALAARPELSAAEHRVEAREAATRAAELGRLPDFGVMATYNSMWPSIAHQVMVGVAIRVPIELDAHEAAVREQVALTDEQRARREAIVDRVRVEVEEARAAWVRARESLRLIEERLLPIARERIDAARAEYVAGGGSFLSLIEAQHALHSIELERLTAEASADLADTELLRAIGAVPGLDHLREAAR